MSNDNAVKVPTVPVIELPNLYCLGCDQMQPTMEGKQLGQSLETLRGKVVRCAHEAACMRMEQRLTENRGGAK